MLRHDAIEHRRDAINGHVWIAHPQDSVELCKDEGHRRQRSGFGKHLHHRNAAHLPEKKQFEDQRLDILEEEI